MLDGIPWPIVSDVGAGGLVVLVVLLILSGRLIPKSHYDELVRARDYWRDAFQAEQEANRLHAQAADAQQMVAETVVKVMSAVQDGGEK